MSEKKPKNIFVHGAISPVKIGEDIAHHQKKTHIGAHSIFMGQVRADNRENGEVAAIEYTAHEAMALEQMHVIREEIFAQFPLTCLHITHSLGVVAVGRFACLYLLRLYIEKKPFMLVKPWLSESRRNCLFGGKRY